MQQFEQTGDQEYRVLPGNSIPAAAQELARKIPRRSEATLSNNGAPITVKRPLIGEATISQNPETTL